MIKQKKNKISPRNTLRLKLMSLVLYSYKIEERMIPEFVTKPSKVIFANFELNSVYFEK